MRAGRLAVLSALLALATAAPAAAAPGDLDPSFDQDGKVVITKLGQEFVQPQLITLQPDGRIVVAGSARFGRFALVRLMPDGSVDQSFGSGGAAIVDAPPEPSFSTLASVDVHDDKIVVVGPDWLARFLPNGELDTTFSDDGFASTGFAEQVTFEDAETLPDGAIVAVGTANGPDAGLLAVARYLPDGSPDPAFATDGTLTSDLDRESARGVAVAAESGGNLVVAAEARTGTGQNLLPIARYLPNGELDPSFAGDGVAESRGLAGASPTTVALTPDGRIVAAGSRLVRGSHWRYSAIVRRLLPNGAADPSFSDDGTAFLDFGHDVEVAVAADGRVILTASVGPGYADLPDVIIGRLAADGSYDSSFGSAGPVTTDFGWFPFTSDLVQQPDGRILVLTDARPRNGTATIALGRYLVEPGPADADADGVLDDRDRCDAHWAPKCPRVPRVLQLRAREGRIDGDLDGPRGGCTDRAPVVLRRQRSGPDKLVARRQTGAGGHFYIYRDLAAGTYYVVAPRFDSPTAGICKRARSRNFDV